MNTEEIYQEPPWVDPPGRVIIPVDLKDCIDQLEKIIKDAEKQEIARMGEFEFTCIDHFGLGNWIRNTWMLWGYSRLSGYFKDLGIDHPDDMSALILTAFHRHLNGKELNADLLFQSFQGSEDSL